MSETMMVISGITALVIAFSTLVGAASKFAPVLKEINKMLADQHKRAKDAKNKTMIQRSDSKRTINKRPRPLGWRSTLGLVICCISLCLMCSIVTPENYPYFFVGTMLCFISILAVFMAEVGNLIVTAILLVLESLESKSESSDS